MISIYNTQSKSKEQLMPIAEDKIQIFVCGPTVYDYIHIGNARTFVVFDAFVKYLRYRKFHVHYIQNITDIDDKIIKKAIENNKKPIDLAREFEEFFLDDIKNLGITSVNTYARATDHIKEVLAQVKKLINGGFAYEIPADGWYFDLSKFPEYGKLSGRKAASDEDAVSRIDENPNKRNVGDFCLWKFSKKDEPAWDFESGKSVEALSSPRAGRPGWHIEDTAITESYFGPQYDIHGGGQDLIFPHHEAETAQQESASGKKPFVRHWMHVAFLINKERKMSKSLGNFTTAHEMMEKYAKETIRFFILSGHYRKPLDFSDKNLIQAAAGSARLSDFYKKLKLIKNESEVNDNDIDTRKKLNLTKENFINALNDDFNTPEALSHLFGLVKEMNPKILKNEINKHLAGHIIEFLEETNDILGIISEENEHMPHEIKKLMERREELRQNEDYAEADKIRTQIENLGWKIEDTIYGSVAIKT